MKMRPRSAPVLLLASLLALLLSPSLSFAAHETEDSVKETSFAASVRNSLNKPLKLIKGGKDDDWHKWKGVGLTTFEVPTVVQDEFVAKWQDLESKVWDQEKDHVIAYDLKKPKLENRVFFSYMEWDSIENLWAHAEKDYVTEFWEWVQGKAILAEFSPLWATVDDARGKKEAMTKTRENAKRQSNPSMHLKKVDPAKDPAYVSMWFHIKPSMKDHFLEAWKDYATGTWKEDKSKVFALREFGFKNHHLVSYGEWDTMNDFFWHMDQPYFQNFQNFIKASDIDMELKPLFKLGKK